MATTTATTTDVGTIRQHAGRLFVWRGIAALLLGVLLLAMPGVSLLLLVALFGAYALVDGILAFAEGIRLRRAKARSWPSFVEGLVGVALAAFAWARPGGVIVVLVLAIAARSLIVGALELGAAILRHREIEHPVLLGIAGAASIAFGVLLAANPSVGALALVWISAVYAFVFGVSFLGLGITMRRGARWRTAATATVALLAALSGGLARAQDEGSIGLPAPSSDVPRARERSAVPPPETSSFNSAEERERRARERAEDELLRFRRPVAGHEFSPNISSTTDQPGMPAPTP
jgi:uncharacterized membrane protein HdeD (DUF308 family)